MKAYLFAEALVNQLAVSKLGPHCVAKSVDLQTEMGK